jgi:hypothetical protein
VDPQERRGGDPGDRRGRLVEMAHEATMMP